MSDIWTLSNVYLYIGILSTALFILKMLMYFFVGGNTELDISFDSITETDVSFNFISIQSILAFLMGFGWSGFSAYNQFHTSGIWTFIIALSVGILLMYFSAYLMFQVKKLEKNVKVDLNELVNKIGRAYTAFAANSQGQIEIDLNGKLSVIDAYNITNEQIAAFTNIIVEKIENNKIYIKKQ